MSSNTGLKYKGTIVFIGQTEFVGDNGFSKRQIVVSDKTSEYPQEISFEFHKDKCSELDNHVVGGLVEIDYNLRGRLWKDNKWFNTLQGWRISKVQVDMGTPEPAQPVQNNINDVDPLPF